MMQAPALVAITTTQMTVGLVLSVVAMVGSGVAFGRITERQKGDHAVLHETLHTLKKGMASITGSVDELRAQYQKSREERVDWNYWRVVTDERLGEHDDEIIALREADAKHATKIIVLEERRIGEADRRQPPPL